MFKPGGWIIRAAPDGVLPAVFDLLLISDDHEFLTVLLSVLSACFVVCLDLPVLIRVKIEEIIDLISSLRIVGIPREHLVGPLCCLYYLSPLAVGDFIILLFGVVLCLSTTNFLDDDFVDLLEVNVTHHRLQYLALHAI